MLEEEDGTKEHIVQDFRTLKEEVVVVAAIVLAVLMMQKEE